MDDDAAEKKEEGMEEEGHVRVGLFGWQVSEQTFFSFFLKEIQSLVPYIQMLHFFCLGSI